MSFTRYKKPLYLLSVLTLVIMGVYSGLWFFMAQKINAYIATQYQDAIKIGVSIEGDRPSINGYPGPHILSFRGKIRKKDTSIIIPQMTIKGFPLSGQTIAVTLPEGFFIEKPSFDENAFLLPTYIHLEGPLPAHLPDALTHEQLATWHEEGGRIDIEYFEVRKEPLKISGQLSLGLDDTLQPAATIPSLVSGHMAFLGDLRKQGMIDDKNVLVAGAILNGLSQENPDTGERFIQTELQLRNGAVMLGPLKIFEIPTIIWPYDAPKPRSPYTSGK